MITKILDKYYSNQVKKHIYYYLLCTFVDIDIKFKEIDNQVILQIKKRKYKDYTNIYRWQKNNSLKHLLYLDDVMDNIKFRIEQYLKEE